MKKSFKDILATLINRNVVVNAKNGKFHGKMYSVEQKHLILKNGSADRLVFLGDIRSITVDVS